MVAPGLPIATVATGTPGGICTVESSASSPLSADESIGTPITGRRRVRGDHTGQMRGRAGADDEHAHTAAGRLGDQAHHARGRPMRRCHRHLPGHTQLGQRLTGGAHHGASESDPIRIRPAPVVIDETPLSESSTLMIALRPMSRRYCMPSNVNRVNRAIGGRHRVRERPAASDHRQHAPAGRHDLPASIARPRVKHQRAGHSAGPIEPVNRLAGLGVAGYPREARTTPTHRSEATRD